VSSYPAVVGLDPSLTSTGVATCRRYRDDEIDTNRVRSAPDKDPVTKKAIETWDSRRERLGTIVEEITAFIPMGSLVMIEGPSYNSKSTSHHDRSGLWWALSFTLHEMGCELCVVSPSQRMMYATGKGVADKDLVLASAVKRYPDIDVTGNDVADGVILLAMGMRLIGRQIDQLPRTHVRALDKIPLLSRGDVRMK
jgi:crossover junction endodeoxyribonuclease RuvC